MKRTAEAVGVCPLDRRWRLRDFEYPLVATEVIGHPACSECGTVMWLSAIEPADKSDHDLRLFECPRCQHATRIKVKFR
jgi:DNA-directed RNA polymerase subunit RPC12/RpoP